MSSAKAFLSGVISFFALLKTLSHSADIAGIERVSKAHRQNLRCSNISIGRVSAGVFSKPGAQGAPCPYPQEGFGTQGSAEIVIVLHWTIQII